MLNINVSEHMHTFHCLFVVLDVSRPPLVISQCFWNMLFRLFDAAGDVLGDVFEVSRIRREDYEFHKGKSEYEDILQCNNLPSSATPRGHQTPAAFLIMASGLDKVLAVCLNKLFFRLIRLTWEKCCD